MTTTHLLGETIADWHLAAKPTGLMLSGQHVAISPLTVAHTDDLHSAFMCDTTHRIWDYLPYGPFLEATALKEWIARISVQPDPYFFAIKPHAQARVLGVCSYLRINPDDGSIEVGHINFSPQLQRTTAATEAMYLMMQWAFENNYRRYEWKCNALNLPSCRAALRFGFSYEGIFRQATISKGRNRDTAWFSIIDKDWPALQAGYQQWLHPSNFDATGMQKRPLSHWTRAVITPAKPCPVALPSAT